MKLFFDTSVLVDIERGREEAVKLLETAQKRDHELWISTVTASEIFAGLYLRKDANRRESIVREVLGQFQWKDLDGEVAQRVGQVHAFLLAHGRRIEYQDTAIAASVLVEKADRLITDDEEHFSRIAGLEQRVWTVNAALKAVAKAA